MGRAIYQFIGGGGGGGSGFGEGVGPNDGELDEEPEFAGVGLVFDAGVGFDAGCEAAAGAARCGSDAGAGAGAFDVPTGSRVPRVVKPGESQPAMIPARQTRGANLKTNIDVRGR